MLYAQGLGGGGGGVSSQPLVQLGAPYPDPISDQNMLFLVPIFRPGL